MDWNHVVMESLAWIGKAFVISLLGMSITAWLLGRYTVWGQQFRRIAWPYFSPSRSWQPLAVVTLIILLTLCSVRLNVLFSFWYNGFYSAMQKLDATAFWFMLGIFALLATVHVARALFNFYVQQAFSIHWRKWLTANLVERWLSSQTYYRSHFIGVDADNPDQRIQQDIETFVTNSLKLSMGLLDAVVSLFAFTLILWGLSGALAILGVEIPRAMVFLVYLYVIIATVLAVYIGRPLIRLSFLNEKFNANFRYALIRVREYGESVAFYKGEGVERRTLMTRFGDVIANAWAIVFRSLKFQGFNLGVSQAAVVFPFIVQAPRLLNKQITLGDMMQTAQAFGQVQDSLSFFRTSYDDFAVYRAVLIRLSGFLDTMQAVEQLPIIQLEPAQQRIALQDVSVQSPSHATLVEKLNLSLEQGSSLIIRGPSGVGKTTLLRALSGLWPFVSGTVARPTGTAALFLPQKPYLPLGTLRQAIYYPANIDAIPGVNSAENDAAADMLRQCQLAQLVPRLDEEAEWSSILSLGEQQRLAIGRALLARPQVLFLDEASSAMDEGLEFAMYQLLRSTLPQVILVSVGHRSSLLGFHERELQLQGQGQWQLQALD